MCSVKEMREPPEELNPVLNHSQARLRGKEAKPNQLKIMQETYAKIAKGVKIRIKDTASSEKTENGKEAASDWSKVLEIKTQNISFIWKDRD